MNPFPNFRDLERTHGVTWHELVDLEPKLAQLLWESRRVGAVCRCWSDVDSLFAPVRHSLAELVGFASKGRRQAVLGSPEAYEVAYWKLHGAVAALLPARAGDRADALQETGRTVASTCTTTSATTGAPAGTPSSERREACPPRENLIVDAPGLKNRRNARRSPTNVGSWDWQEAVNPRFRHPLTNAVRRRFDRVTGSWLGGILLGIGGCIFGTCTSYRHPVGVTISALWWGIYFGCFGIWLGSAFGMLAERVRSSLSERSDGKADETEYAQLDGRADPSQERAARPGWVRETVCESTLTRSREEELQ
jgi:hypothetical protein